MLNSFTGADISHVIQISVAPVFLLAGIGSILGVMTNRLARVIDRARSLEPRLANLEGSAYTELHARIGVMSQRAQLISRAIALCTMTALLVCSVIITLFFGAFFAVSTAIPAALLFISALITFASGLLFFLREIFVATASLRIGPIEQAPSSIIK